MLQNQVIAEINQIPPVEIITLSFDLSRLKNCIC